jgi:hypothetical protein
MSTLTPDEAVLIGLLLATLFTALGIFLFFLGKME